jgi:hypothetical protein
MEETSSIKASSNLALASTNKINQGPQDKYCGCMRPLCPSTNRIHVGDLSFCQDVVSVLSRVNKQLRDYSSGGK